MQKSLLQHRKEAADCSCGISSLVIKRLIISIIKRNKLSGSALDYGAGKGELLQMLKSENLFDKLAGSDIMERPEGLDKSILWYEQDLNEPLTVEEGPINLVICSEVIEHLENPRATFREISDILVPSGHLLLTMPNQESIRSLVGVLFGGHFTFFLGSSYPAHITALLRMDLERICKETGFAPPSFSYTNSGGIPKIPSVTWQKISRGRLRGRLFSDNIAMLTHKL